MVGQYPSKIGNRYCEKHEPGYGQDNPPKEEEIVVIAGRNG
jgi:hypothetical protein